MMLRIINSMRGFSTMRILCKPCLSSDYTSKKLWNERFNCKLLSDDAELIKNINDKIIMGEELNNLEVDVFINIASPGKDESDQLRESIKMIRNLRRSLNANLMLPSTHHAFCRLLLDSERLPTLMKILENRVDYGIFPDFFVLNLLLERTLNDEKSYVLGARLASWVMLQEEFGINEITDVLSIYSTAKYIELQSNFSDWILDSEDELLKMEDEKHNSTVVDQQNEKVEEDDEEEEDAEYIRIPFLRNLYRDDHFDLDNPRLICGKTLSMLASAFRTKDATVASVASLLGSVLQGRWDEASEGLDECHNDPSKSVIPKHLLKHLIENLNDIKEPSEEQKSALFTSIDRLPDNSKSFSQLIEDRFSSNTECERADIEALRNSFIECSELRIKYLQAQIKRENRSKLIEEIRLKKEELDRREQYLYFYDNLRRLNLRRIDYN